MSDNVIMPSKFARKLTDGDLDQLKEAGVAVEAYTSINELDLDDPQQGEITIGVLDMEEAALYEDYYHTFADLDGLLRDINSDVLLDTADAIKSGNDQSLSTVDMINKRMSADDRKEISKLRRRTEMLKGVLYWRIAERLDAHEHVLGVRSGGRIVRRTGQF